MLEINELPPSWADQEYLEFSAASLEGLLWEGLEAYLDHACMAGLE